ncbi:MAG: ABC transporter substrate-binding protein [Anaerolineae bacterium]|nr:ABC transporter substrate-binding protein [Anaerolineae bacterium]
MSKMKKSRNHRIAGWKLSPITAIGLVLVMLFAGCKPQAPTATPAPPATDTPQPEVAPTQEPVQEPVTSRVLRYVAGNEVNTYDPKDQVDWQSGLFDVYETLTYLDGETGELLPRLAVSWEQVETTIWRFKLRKGVTFHNGEPFTAEAVRASFERVVQPDAGNKYYAGSLLEAKPVDDYTVDIITEEPDPIFPRRAIFLFIAAPGWLQTASADEIAITAVGTGPYKLVEWKKGQYLLMEANENYWGTPARVPQLKIFPRSESSVRASMVATDEADIAYGITYEDADRVPVAVSASNVRVQGLRLNTKHPVLQDVRVRKAMVLAVDVRAIADTIYLGKVAPANAQMVNASAVGWNPDLEPYPYDPETAKQLIEEAGAAGTELTIIGKEGGYFQKDTEQLEAIANMLNAVGLNVKVQLVENTLRRKYLKAGQPDAPQSDLLHVQHGNDLMDASHTFIGYYVCDGGSSQFCDPELDAMVEKAKPLTGETRDKALQDAWTYVYDKYPWIPTINVEFLYATGKDVDWTPRVDGIMYFAEIGFK